MTREELDQLDSQVEATFDLGETLTDIDARTLQALIAQARRAIELDEQLKTRRDQPMTLESRMRARSWTR